MTIVVTGATGHLGRLAVESLLARGVAADEIVAAGRRVEALDDLAARGVRTAAIDFDEPSTLAAAFAGADKVLLVSASTPGRRAAQHQAAIDAAVAAGVSHLVYTSAPQATTSALVLAPEHKATEQAIAASGIPATILRNGWYTENYLSSVDAARATGQLVASVGAGRVASASRADYADAAAVVLTEDGHIGRVYELSGDVAWSYDDLAAAIEGLVGRPVVFRDVTPEEHTAILTGVGLDAGTAAFVVALDQNTKDGLLAATTGDLARLIGRPTTPLADGLGAAVAATAGESD